MIIPSTIQEKRLISLLKSGNFKELKIYQVHDSYFELKDGKVILIDGGIEMHFSKGIFCVGWASEFDEFVVHNDPFETIYEQANFTEIENKNLQKLVNDKINHVEFKAIHFEFIADYTMRTVKENRYVEIKMAFERGNELQLSLVDYDTETGKEPFNYKYHLSTELLIALNEEIEIK